MEKSKKANNFPKIDVKIKGFKKELNGSSEVYFYTIAVNVLAPKKNSWTVQRRYNEFYLLSKSLRSHQGWIPKLPGKTLFKVKKSEALEKRRSKLDRFIKMIIQKKDLFCNTRFLDFFQLQRHLPNVKINKLRIISRLKNDIGFRDFKFYKDKKKSENYLFVVLSEMSSARFVKYIKNLKMPWSQRDKFDSKISPLGIMEVYSEVKPFVFEKITHKYFKYQAFCLHYSKMMGIVVVGLINGSVSLLVIDKDKKLIQNKNMKIHKKKVVEVWVDPTKQLLYSIGEDKALRVTSLNTGEQLSICKFSEKPLSGMSVLRKQMMSVICDKGGNIYFHDLSTSPPRLTQTLKTGINVEIRGIDLCRETGKLFAASHKDGLIYQFEISLPVTPTSKVKKLGSIRGYKKPRNIKFWKDRNELYVGHSKGKIAVYKLSNYQCGSIFSLRCHRNDITALKLDSKNGFLVSASKDGRLKMWSPPDVWEFSENSNPTYLNMKYTKLDVECSDASGGEDSSDEEGNYQQNQVSNASLIDLEPLPLMTQVERKKEIYASDTDSSSSSDQYENWED